MQTSNSFSKNSRPVLGARVYHAHGRTKNVFGKTDEQKKEGHLGKNLSGRRTVSSAKPFGAFEGIVAHAQAPRMSHKVARPSGAQYHGQRVKMRPEGDVASESLVSGKPVKKTTGKKGGRRDGRRFSMPNTNRLESKHNGVSVPPLAEKRLRIVPLGGQEEVGRNMTVFEYGNDIVIVDMGLQFPEEDMPGIDYIVPNVNYLKGKEKNIRGVIFTHGHLDHIGAAPILLKQLGYPPVIARDLTLALIKHKVDDQEKGAASRLKLVRVKTLDDRIRLGAFEARFFEVEHSIMDAIGIVLLSPSGSIIHMGDWTISNEPIEEKEISYKHLADLPRPTILMLESLGALKKGVPPSEQEVHSNLQNLIRSVPGRLIIGTFASQIRRISYLIEYAEAQGKKVALEGYSMKMNIEVAKELGYIKVKQDTLITVNDIHKYPDNKVVVICTGAQGELNAALSRIVTDNHRFIKLQKSDTIVFSSSVIPGNERTIQRLKDNLYRKCDNIIHSDIMEIHIGGHSTAQGMEEMIRQVKPTYFLPVYANHYFLKEAAKIAYRIGFPEQNVFVLDNGGVFETDEHGMGKMLKEKADTSYVFIDGLGVGDIGHVVLRDRQVLAQDGMVVITVIIDSKSKNIIGNIQITSRGFIHVKENFDLVNEAKRKVQKVVKDNTAKGTSLDWDLVRNQIREVVGQFLFQKTERRPMILPVVIEV
ncbi:MAG: ribonuclease J [Candidatus Moranbacteria bacterium]|nr:ribonuclease J [Candidatus Moranbacteria bacterium]